MIVSESESQTKSCEKLLDEPEMPSLGECASVVFKMSFPIIIGNWLSVLVDAIDYFVIGNMCGAESLGALGLGTLTSKLLAQSFIFGLTSGYDTFGSQCIGKGEYRMCGIYMYRAWLVILLIASPTFVLVCLSRPILVVFGVTPHAAELASVYAISLIPYSVLGFTFDLLGRFLIAQRITKPLIFINGIATCLHPLWVYLFVIVLKMDYIGTSYALCVTGIVRLASAAVYLAWSGVCKLTLPPIDRTVFMGWLNFAKVTFPSGVMYLIDFFSFLLVGIFSGSLDSASLAANQSLFNFILFGMSISVGLGFSACALVGNSLGARRPKLAQRYAKLATVIHTICLMIFSLVVFLFCNQIARLYCSDPQVEVQFLIGLKMMLLEFLFDGTECLLCKMLVSMAKQAYATGVNLTACSLCMLPMSYILIFHYGGGIRSIWLSLTVAYFITTTGFAYGLVSQDWKKVAAETAERIEKDTKLMPKEGVQYDKEAEENAIPLKNV